MKTYIKTLGVMALAASFSFGEDAPKGPKGPKGPRGDRPSPEKMFQRLDADGDGNLTLDELKASPRGQKDGARTEAFFTKLDSDGSGGVSLEEFKAHRPPHPPRKGRKGGRDREKDEVAE